ncbi:MAG: hypothetical protein ACI9BD_000381 [Candidatus Marinamargulisbacteria bacterium]|jgi:hypothetical protein
MTTHFPEDININKLKDDYRLQSEGLTHDGEEAGASGSVASSGGSATQNPTYIVVNEEAKMSNGSIRFYFEYNDHYFMLTKIEEEASVKLKYDRQNRLMYKNQKEVTDASRRTLISDLMTESERIFYLVDQGRAIVLVKKE